MPRLAISAADARDIVTYFTERDGTLAAAADSAASDSVNGDLRRGRELFETRGCAGCHEFTGASVKVRPKAPTFESETDRAVALAPDLRFTRARFRPDALKSWIQNPAQIKPSTRMPALGLNANDARDLAAFISKTPLDDAKISVPARLPILERRVSFNEVNERVLMQTCRHCHTNPDRARGDGGPGNTGGFGFSARHLDLSSYAGVNAGYVDAQGVRRSVFERGRDGTPLLVVALLARHAEQVGSPGKVRGMPLGLPPLRAEQIQLVESWIAQGRPL
jgi:cytochrome c2